MSFDIAQWVNSAIYDKETKPLDAQEAIIFKNLLLLDNSPLIDEDISTQFLYQVMQRRLEVYGMKMTDSVQLMLLTLCTNPAELVIYLTILSHTFKDEIVDMTKLAHLYPEGFLTTDSLIELWELTKK